MEQLPILNKKQTLDKIKRIAFEIYENNFQEKEIYIAGIFDKGYLFAQFLKSDLEKICAIKIILVKVTLDKFSPQQSEIELDIDIKLLKKKTIILVDDVMNSGRTMAYSMKPFLNIEIKKLQTAVVVDRDHKTFPISADYVGYSLSTTLKETINVVLDEVDEFGVYMV